MLEISETDLLDAFRLYNPWWDLAAIEPDYRRMPRRAYFDFFFDLVAETDIRRAPILMGPRRVGKTVLIHHTIQELIDRGVPPQQIFYMSLETPICNKVPLEKLLRLYLENFAIGRSSKTYIFFDEVQYLRDWEVHLKVLVDQYRDCQFTVSGSAAAALKLKSTESGAGRFTDFYLPPLSFAEFLAFRGLQDELIAVDSERSDKDKLVLSQETYDNISKLNEELVSYLNFGGFPELVYSSSGKLNAKRYVRSDIIDKVLLKDLPSLYGISDVQELNSLFTTLAFNTGEEVSLEGLSKGSSVSKNTLKRYLDYLESAFLIRRVTRLDRNARRFQRATQFKVYLTNPTMHAALFGPTNADHEKMGHLVETAIFAQWFHDPVLEELTYARWDKGEVDLVKVNVGSQEPEQAVEVKWSNAAFDRPNRLTGLLAFAQQHEGTLQDVLVTTRTKAGRKIFRTVALSFEPAATYCYLTGRNIVPHASLFNESNPDQFEMDLE